MKYIFDYFPKDIKELLLENVQDNKEVLEEIRIRVEKSIILKFNNKEKVINHFVKSEEILNILGRVCENSIYSYQNEIAEGFITVKGGHRIGISGSVVIENGKVININYINALNFRISRQVIGCSKKIIPYIINLKENSIYNTLIISPPGTGKTTILRDLVRQISNGIRMYKFKGINVSIIDERGEIAALYKGIPQNDVGIKTDVMDNIPKSIGIKMMIRTMSPQVIVADEIGTLDDSYIINYAICSGCKGIFTAHGLDFDDVYLNPILKEIINMHLFEVIIFLDSKNKGEFKDIYLLNKKNLEYKKVEDEKENDTNMKEMLEENVSY
jgi:stage III sporulation protein AA